MVQAEERAPPPRALWSGVKEVDPDSAERVRPGCRPKDLLVTSRGQPKDWTPLAVIAIIPIALAPGAQFKTADASHGSPKEDGLTSTRDPKETLLPRHAPAAEGRQTR